MLSHIKNIIKNTLINFKDSFKHAIFFQLLYKIVVLSIFIPINYYRLNELHLSKNRLINFISNIKDTAVIILIILIFSALFLEFFILTYISNKAHKKEKISLLGGIKSSIKLLQCQVNISLLKTLFICVVIGPLLGTGLYYSLIRESSIPALINIVLTRSFNAKILFSLLCIILLLLLFRWLFSIPSLVIEDVNLKTSFKHSILIFNKNKFAVSFYIFLFILLNAGIKFISSYSYIFIGNFMISTIGETNSLNYPLILFYLLIFIICYTFISLITFPLFISFIVELYYKFRFYNVTEREVTLEKEVYSKFYTFLLNHKKALKFSLIFIFSILVVIMTKVASIDINKPSNTTITAHRGTMKNMPENSLSGIFECIKEGVDCVEIDVMNTKDNHVVLFHDQTLKRIDGTKRRIKDMTLAEVRQVDNGSYINKSFEDERIPTLDEVLSVAKGSIKLNIELKASYSNGNLPEEVAKLIEKYDMQEDVVISSFEYNSLQKFKKLMPEVPVGYILSYGFVNYKKLNVDFISIDYSMLTKDLVYIIHSLDKDVYVWGVNTKRKIRDAIKLNVDNIITDDISTARYTLAESKYYDKNYLTWFYDNITSIIKYVKI